MPSHLQGKKHKHNVKPIDWSSDFAWPDGRSEAIVKLDLPTPKSYQTLCWKDQNEGDFCRIRLFDLIVRLLEESGGMGIL